MGKRILIVCFLAFFSQFLSAQNTKPNIVVIFADDLGYSDIGCYGGEIQTPNIDKLAKEGIRFTHFINGSKCAPSRASLLTGLYPIETGCAGPPTQMQNGVTIAEMLKKAGYKTLMTGKWHGKEHPVKRGFDHFFGTVSGSFNYFKPGAKQKYMEDAEVLKSFPSELKQNFYTTDTFTNKALNYLDAQENNNEPFFLYVAYNAPHYPLQAWPEDIAKHRGKYLKGWDVLRKERFQRQQKMGIVEPNWELTKRDEKVTVWENYKNKDIADLTMATYAAMVDRMDQNIGKLIAKLEETGKKENTLIIFLSDNGGNAEGHMWDGVNPNNKPGLKNSQAKLGIEWANASNTPFKSYKRSTFNGGQVTPFIVSWPNGNLKKGSITRQKGNLTDIMPTFLELAKVTYPEGETWKVPAEGKLKTSWKIRPLSGKSLVPAFYNEGVTRENFKGYFQGSRMLIANDWKIVSDGGDGAILHLYDYPWELYNLKKDGAETNNLARKFPKLVDSLDVVYRNWIDDVDSYTGLKSHMYFQSYYTKQQKQILKRLEEKKQYKKLMNKRRGIGLSIVEELKKSKVKMKTTLGMEKLPMSYFALVNSGRKYSEYNSVLSNLYKSYDKNIKICKTFCDNLGIEFSEVWKIQEKIRNQTTSLEVN
ncbi:arylsulfatase [Lutibacter oricola]|uniref:Arylsulfatase n=1 Tax=Lutibacter oricola TaxID=762486 RepID=A0A1H2SUR0_9FLAO|nr:arylsulfatase [Lutibacter oricola]SDW35318.1 arylsulfatase [Lutibacter oricola]